MSLLLIISEHSHQPPPKKLCPLAGTPHCLETLKHRIGFTDWSVTLLAWNSVEPSLEKSGLGHLSAFFYLANISRSICVVVFGRTSFLSIFHLPIYHLMGIELFPW